MIEAIGELFTWPYAIFFVRLLPTLIIFRWNLLGSLLFLVLDANDYEFLRANTDTFSMATYQTWDKIFDQYYLTVQLIILYRTWKDDVFRRTGAFLYYFRLIGVVLFEITGLRWIFVIFSNLFEHFFQLVLIIKGFVGEIKDPKRISIIIMVILIPIKLYQELYLHTKLDLPIILNKNGQMALGILSLVVVIYLEFIKKRFNDYIKKDEN